MNDGFPVAQQNLWKAHQIQESTYDHYDKHCGYEVGNYILYYDNRARHGRCMKLNHPWTSPWVIKKVIMDVTVYRIQCFEASERKVKPVVHFNYLKPYVQRRDRNQTMQRADSKGVVRINQGEVQ